ncbi:hypothetical protein [Celeribacter sp.]|uniref:hypothetical protein n=1 Tax=Celeribacter sp. TaxID=1890673 RepID=UPI003A901EEC
MAIVDVTPVKAGGGANDTLIGRDDYDTYNHGSVGTYSDGYSYMGESLEYELPDGTTYGDGDVNTHEDGEPRRVARSQSTASPATTSTSPTKTQTGPSAPPITFLRASFRPIVAMCFSKTMAATHSMTKSFRRSNLHRGSMAQKPLI